MVSFDVTEQEAGLIALVVDRIETLHKREAMTFDRLHWHMDITACHANGCPLKLHDLLVGSEFDFTHDVFGISRHLDRKTGKLQNCFLPRYADVQKMAEAEKSE